VGEATAGRRKRRQGVAALLTSAYPPAIAYSRVGTGRTPSVVPSNSNFPASHLGSEPGLVAQSYRAFSFSATRPTCRLLEGDSIAPARFATKVIGFARTVGVSSIRASSIRAIAIITQHR
jgi:hypothetical protein